MKPYTVTCGGSVSATLRRQASVMDGVQLGLMRRMEMGRVEVPLTDGSATDDMVGFRVVSEIFLWFSVPILI